jgi:hypothetical protein
MALRVISRVQHKAIAFGVKPTSNGGQVWRGARLCFKSSEAFAPQRGKWYRRVGTRPFSKPLLVGFDFSRWCFLNMTF